MIFLFHKKYIQRDIVIFIFFIREISSSLFFLSLKIRIIGGLSHYTTIWYSNSHF